MSERSQPDKSPAGELALGAPRVHLRSTASTSSHAKRLALAGAPHGTLVSAAAQTAGRGRQGRSWWAPDRGALLFSLVLRDEQCAQSGPAELLGLRAAVALCDAIGPSVQIKWPNDVVLAPAAGAPAAGALAAGALAKVAGILVESRPGADWSILGIGVNAAASLERAPASVRARAASLELPQTAIEPLLCALLRALGKRLYESAAHMLGAWSKRDVLRGREVAWSALTGESVRAPAHGRAAGVDPRGRLVVERPDGSRECLSAGEVHLIA